MSDIFNIKMVSITIISLLLLFIFCLNSFAVTCDMLAINVEDARTKLRRAANADDFDSAKNYANRAKSPLEDAAMSALDCKCDLAYMEFDTAATRVRRAANAYSPEEFVQSLNGAIRAFNSGIHALRNCAGMRR